MIPLSAAQRRIWFLHRLEGASTTYHISRLWHVRGPLDVSALEAALADVVDRHEALRTVFGEHGGTPFQRVLAPAAPWSLRVADIDEEHLASAADEIAWRPFDLGSEPPFRAHLFVLGAEQYALHLVRHHIAGDGWSLATLVRDIAAAYRARRAGTAPGWTPLTVRYADFAAQHSADEHEAMAFWLDALRDLPQAILPTDRPRPAVPTNRGDTVGFSMPPELHRRIAQVARAARATPFMAYHAAIAALLTQFGAGTDVPLGVPVDGRTDTAFQDVVGFFVNTLVLRADTSGDPTYNELLDRVRRFDRAAFAYRELPFERIVEALNPVRSAAHHPVFQVMLAYQNTPHADLALTGVQVQVDPRVAQVSRYDLTLTLAERDDRVDGSFQYRVDLFERATVERLPARLRALLDAVSRQPDVPLSQLEVVPEERDQLEAWGRGRRRAAVASSLPEQIAAQARATPEAPAVRARDGQLTYASLDARASRLARRLLALGAAPERVVAIALPRTTDLVVAWLAVMKTGAAYLPLDPSHPPARIAAMLGDACPRVLVSQSDVRLPPLATVTRVDVDRTNLQPTPAAPDVTPRPDHLAYVIFTSGSTGAPKAVTIEHRALTNIAASLRELAGSRARAVAWVTPFSFDMSLKALTRLADGACLHVLDDDLRLDPRACAAYLRDHAIDLLPCTPSQLDELVSRGLLDASVELWLGGEPISAELWERLRTMPGIRALNMYGPTECTVDVTTQWLDETEHPTGGRPLPNTTVVIADEAGAPVPLGVPGEVLVGGAQLARGYLHRPELTAARFVATASGERLYRTGDRGRWTNDGRLQLLGRLDDQVKLRGVRLELGEIEAVLARDPDVAQTAASVREDRPGDRRLVAYVVPAAGATPTPATLRAHAARLLPEVMLPSAYVLVEDLPLTAHGKLDRARLPAPDATSAPAVGVAPEATSAAAVAAEPRTATEAAVCRLFAQVLGRPHVGMDDDFFAHGGHSLLVPQLLDRLTAELDVELPLRAFFEVPTAAGVVSHIERVSDDPDVPRELWADATLELADHRTARREPASPSEAVLLTGATGFVGAFVLRALLDRSSARVHCLVRASTPEHARQRVYQALRRWSLSTAGLDRVLPVIGDLGAPGLGVSVTSRAELTATVDAIVHIGAVVHMARSYADLAAPNVHGTHELLRLAATGRATRFHYVSTVSVLRDDRGDAAAPEAPVATPAGLRGGYALSKWAAERLVMAAAGHGVATHAYRLARVTGDTVHGRWPRDDLMALILRSALRVGALPDRPFPDLWTPVDAVANALTSLVLAPPRDERVLHLTDVAPVEADDVARWLTEAGAPVQVVDWRAWLAAVEDDLDTPIAPLLPAFREELRGLRPDARPARRNRAYRSDAARTALAGVWCPPVDADLISRYVAQFRHVMGRGETPAAEPVR